MAASTTRDSGSVLNAVLLDNQSVVPAIINADEPPPAKAKASPASMAFVLLNTALGAGMLGLPGAYAKAGLLGGTLVCGNAGDSRAVVVRRAGAGLPAGAARPT